MSDAPSYIFRKVKTINEETQGHCPKYALVPNHEENLQYSSVNGICCVNYILLSTVRYILYTYMYYIFFVDPVENGHIPSFLLKRFFETFSLETC